MGDFDINLFWKFAFDKGIKHKVGRFVAAIYDKIRIIVFDQNLFFNGLT